MYRIVFMLALMVLSSCRTSIPPIIIDKPIKFNAAREQLSVEYLKTRYQINQDSATITPKMIVLHWTAIPTLEKSFDAFNNITLPNWRPEITNASALNVSAHFLVDQDGTIYRLMPETKMARHVIGLNHCAIGIENVGGTEDTPLTEAQLQANIALVSYLANSYPIEYVIGHYEYTNFEKHPLWKEVDTAYRTTKTDPGRDFLAAVKNATKSFHFKPTPKQ